MANKHIIDTCFNEEKTAQSILNFDLIRYKVFKRHIGNESFIAYYSLLIKYLLSLNELSVETIKKVVKKHIAIASYAYMRDKISNNDRIYTKELDNLLDNHLINLDFLLTNDFISYGNPFSELYSHEDYKDIKNDIAEISSMYEYYFTGEHHIIGFLNTILDYFCYGCKFADLKYYNHSDLIIAHHLIDGELCNFTFECDDNTLDKYWISNDPFKEIDIKEKIFGHIINILIRNKNIDYSKPIRIMQPYYYEIMFNIARKKLIQYNFSFFKVDATNCTAYIDRDVIKDDINFKYNNEKYIFGKEGIIKL